jgi:peptide/nickel transport system permease protein
MAASPDPARTAAGPTTSAGAAGGAAGAAASPWRTVWRRLRRNRVAMTFGGIFAALIASALLAPLYATHVAKTGPNTNHLSDTIVVDGRRENVVALDGVPIGPQWLAAGGRYVLGADRNGRDVLVRLLYGARNSLFIGITASLITAVLAVLAGLLAGWFRGWVDAVISRGLDVLWAFPVLLLGVALGVSLALGGLDLGVVEISGGSLWVPTLIIALVNVVYLARPIRGQVLALREREFVEAARAQGAGDVRIMVGELLPNLASTILVLLPVLVANAVALEAALSFLGAGVQPPEPSWGTMLGDGIELLITSPHLTLVPGAMLTLTVLSLNVLGDGVRDALDPRAPVRLER